MKTILILGIALFALIIFAFNNQHIKTMTINKSSNEEPVSDDSLILAPPQYDSNSIEFIVNEMLVTSPRFRQLTKESDKVLVKQGELPYGIKLEASPNKNQNRISKISRSYDFKFCETGTDRKLKTYYFSFNPDNRQLYEYDEANNRLKSLKYNRNLLAKYDALCK
jgi:hypothetical protein